MKALRNAKMKIPRKTIGAGFAAALSLVAYFEGERLAAYYDPVGIPTVCFGHTATAKIGQTKTREECRDLLAEDLYKSWAAVDRHAKVPLTDGQRAAFSSFVYNVGEGAFASSTLLRKLNAGDYVGACNELPRWVYAKGIKLPGLVKRREAERQLCLS